MIHPAMRHKTCSQPAVSLLGIECGGTHTSALFEEGGTGRRSAWSGGPSNLRLLSDAQHLRNFAAIGEALPQPGALAVCMAGVRTEADVARIRRLVGQVWPGIPCTITHDLESALAAAPRLSGTPAHSHPTRVLILSGTGSCCLGRSPHGKSVKIGGWGHILGDKGSAFEIGLRALKAVVFYLDRDQEWTLLGQRLLRRLQLNDPNDFIQWVLSAPKEQVAGLAVDVFESAAKGDRIARDILDGAASSLASDALACARRVARPRERVQFVLAGGVLLKQPRFAANVKRRLIRGWKNAVVSPLTEASVVGALEIARRLALTEAFPVQGASKAKPVSLKSEPRPVWEDCIPAATGVSPTERRNTHSMALDRMPLGQAIALFLTEDAALPQRVAQQTRSIAKTIRLIVAALKQGGRLIYVGAGTSGRLGVLDASECPPTFRTPPEWVQGIMAGGHRALWESIEGAEDEPAQGAQALAYRGVSRLDVVVGIAASGRTPFVWGALAEARRRGAKTVLLACNPLLRFQKGHRPDAVIAMDAGPEILTGSTRLKAGTATKQVLNILTTLSMVRMGKVVENLMIDVNPSNIKLRGRAVGILKELTHAEDSVVRAALEKTDWHVQQAFLLLKRKKTP